MSTALLSPVPRQQALTLLGAIAAGAKLYTYLSGSSTPYPTYTTAGMSVEHATTIVADASGLFPAIYLEPGVQYRMTLTESDGTPIWGPLDEIEVPDVQPVDTVESWDAVKLEVFG